MIYEKIVKENQKLETQIQTLQSQLNTLPKGKLICASNGKWQKWYHSTEHGTNYLSKKELQLAQQLAYKKYLSLQLENLLQEKKATNSYLSQHNSNAEQEEYALVTSPQFKELLAPFFNPLSEELQEWMKAPYDKNKNHPENLTNRAYSGNIVRSKSEALIDMFLYKNKIPFRYECLLEIEKIVEHYFL